MEIEPLGLFVPVGGMQATFLPKISEPVFTTDLPRRVFAGGACTAQFAMRAMV